MTGEFSRCISEGLIRKETEVKTRVAGELATAEKFCKAAEKNAGIVEKEMAVIAAYNSSFHSMRALLFAKGYTERSHYCLVKAVAELYKENKGLSDAINALDRERIARHKIQYDGEDATELEAALSIELAKEVLALARKELGQK